jgi:hypothetical protein
VPHVGLSFGQRYGRVTASIAAVSFGGHSDHYPRDVKKGSMGE